MERMAQQVERTAAMVAPDEAAQLRQRVEAAERAAERATAALATAERTAARAAVARAELGAVAEEFGRALGRREPAAVRALRIARGDGAGSSSGGEGESSSSDSSAALDIAAALNSTSALAPARANSLMNLIAGAAEGMSVEAQDILGLVGSSVAANGASAPATDGAAASAATPGDIPTPGSGSKATPWDKESDAKAAEAASKVVNCRRRVAASASTVALERFRTSSKGVCLSLVLDRPVLNALATPSPKVTLEDEAAVAAKSKEEKQKAKEKQKEKDGKVSRVSFLVADFVKTMCNRKYLDQDEILMDLQNHVLSLFGAVAHMRADPDGDWLDHFAELSDDELMALATSAAGAGTDTAAAVDGLALAGGPAAEGADAMAVDTGDAADVEGRAKPSSRSRKRKSAPGKEEAEGKASSKRKTKESTSPAKAESKSKASGGKKGKGTGTGKGKGKGKEKVSDSDALADTQAKDEAAKAPSSTLLEHGATPRCPSANHPMAISTGVGHYENFYCNKCNVLGRG